MNKKNALGSIVFVLSLTLYSHMSVNAQTSYDAFLKSQKGWLSEMGLSIGLSSGLQFQYGNTYKKTCRYVLKKHAFRTGLLYEGLLFGKALSDEIPLWSMGGIRTELVYLFYPKMNVKGHRLFLGGGVEPGTRVIDKNHVFQVDFVATLGYEYSFYDSSGIPLLIKLSAQLNKPSENSFYIVLPTFSIFMGK